MHIEQRVHNAKPSPQKKINRRQISQDTFRLVQACQFCSQSGPNNVASPSSKAVFSIWESVYTWACLPSFFSFFFFWICSHQALFLCSIPTNTIFLSILARILTNSFHKCYLRYFYCSLWTLISTAHIWNLFEKFLSAVWTYSSYMLESSWFLTLLGPKFETHIALRVVPAFISAQLYPWSRSLFLWFSLLFWTSFYVVKLYF